MIIIALATSVLKHSPVVKNKPPKTTDDRNKKIVGLLVARDESVVIALTLESIKDVIDEIVFIDQSSIDGTDEIVKEKCKEYGIPLTYRKVGLNHRLPALRNMALNLGKKLNPDFYFVLDGDMVFYQPERIRYLAETSTLFDAFWFKTLNLYGDMDSGLISGFNQPHMWLFRNKEGIMPGANYYVNPHIFTTYPKKNEFLGWNLNGMKYYEHLFWRLCVSHMRRWNKHHGTTLSVSQFIDMYFNPANEKKQLHPGYEYQELTDDFKKSYVLERISTQTFTVKTIAEMRNRQKGDNLTVEDMHSKFLDFPDFFRNWECPFKIQYEDLPNIEEQERHNVKISKRIKVIGREPDLIDVPFIHKKDNPLLSPRTIKYFRTGK